ncbi:MAG: archease [Planctomycetes bacterium]|nr:archease [Planctomycetota bacterium]
MTRYELVDHTADIGVVVQSSSLTGLFENAAYALFDLQVNLDGVDGVELRQIDVEADDLEQALVAWLQRLLVILDLENLVFSRFEVAEACAHGVRGRAWGEKLDVRRHELRGQIKAVTYHELEVKKTEKGWRAQIVFDV